jgi:hypothetical protein
MAHMSMLVFRGISILLNVFQADPIDKNSASYQAGKYLAYIFMVVFVAAIIYTVVKRSRKK